MIALKLRLVVYAIAVPLFVSICVIINAARDQEGNTPLMRALGDPKLVQLLIEGGADLNARNIHGETALEIAKKHVARDLRRAQIVGWQSPAGEDYRDNRRTVEVLLKAGARR